MSEQEFLFDQEPERPVEADSEAAAGPEEPVRRATRKKKAEPPFEEALQRLETIVEEMERGELSLEECLKRFEQASALAKFCDRRLKEIEKKVEILLNQGEAEAEWQPFEGPAGRGGAS